jgi:hypothetical protein
VVSLKDELKSTKNNCLVHDCSNRFYSLFLGSAQPASIYRNVCLCVCTDYKKVGEVVLTTLRPGWRQVLQYKCTVAGGQFICIVVQLVQSKCVCYTGVRTAFYRIAVIFFKDMMKLSIRKINFHKISSSLYVYLQYW